MANVFDVAAYILRKSPQGMTAMKLQKLVYYSQAWSLVWDEKPLFPEEIQAWANGPVVPALYDAHRGAFTVEANDIARGNPNALNEQERETVDAVLRFYGPKSAHELSELTHCEQPWMSARRDLAPGQRGSEIISHASMAEYYDGLTQRSCG